MNLLIDMNLSPDWVMAFKKEGINAVHWSTIGSPKAPDRLIMEWALKNEYIVFTHDLDFGTLLALTQAEGPSVIQIRTQDIFPDQIGGILISALKQFELQLKQGALIIIDDTKARARILPLER
jgi:predicted nuclease of predicted toxin-antitoxin system